MTSPAHLTALPQGLALASFQNSSGADVCTGTPSIVLEASTESGTFYTTAQEGYWRFLHGDIQEAKQLLCSVRPLAPHLGWEVWSDDLLYSISSVEESDRVLLDPLAAYGMMKDEAILAFEDTIASADDLRTLTEEYAGLNQIRQNLDFDSAQVCLLGGIGMADTACHNAVNIYKNIGESSALFGLLLHIPKGRWTGDEYHTAALAELLKDGNAQTALSYAEAWVQSESLEHHKTLNHLKSLIGPGVRSFFDEFNRLLSIATTAQTVQERRQALAYADDLVQSLAFLFPSSKTLSRLALAKNELASVADKSGITGLDERKLREDAVKLSSHALQLAGGRELLDEEGWRAYAWTRSELAEYYNDTGRNEKVSDADKEETHRLALETVQEAINLFEEAIRRFPKNTQIKSHLAFAYYNLAKINAHHTQVLSEELEIYRSALRKIRPLNDTYIDDPSTPKTDKARGLRAEFWAATEGINVSGGATEAVANELKATMERVKNKMAGVMPPLKDIAALRKNIELLLESEPSLRGRLDLAFGIAKNYFSTAFTQDIDSTGKNILSQAVAGYGDILGPCDSTRLVNKQSKETNGLFLAARIALEAANRLGANPTEYYRAWGHINIEDHYFKAGIESLNEALEISDGFKKDPETKSKPLSTDNENYAKKDIVVGEKMLACGADNSLSQADQCQYAAKVLDRLKNNPQENGENVLDAVNVLAYVCDVGQVQLPNHSDYKLLWDTVKYLRWELMGLQTPAVLEKLQPAELALTIYNKAGVIREIRTLTLGEVKAADYMVKEVSDAITRLEPVFTKMMNQKALSKFLDSELKAIQATTNLQSDSLEILENNHGAYSRFLAKLDELGSFAVITQLDPIPTDIRNATIKMLAQLDDRIKTLEQERGVSVSQIRANIAEHDRRKEEAVREKRRAIVARRDVEETWYRWYVDEVRGTHDRYTYPILGAPNR